MRQLEIKKSKPEVKKEIKSESSTSTQESKTITIRPHHVSEPIALKIGTLKNQKILDAISIDEKHVAIIVGDNHVYFGNRQGDEKQENLTKILLSPEAKTICVTLVGDNLLAVGFEDLSKDALKIYQVALLDCATSKILDVFTAEDGIVDQPLFLGKLTNETFVTACDKIIKIWKTGKEKPVKGFRVHKAIVGASFYDDTLAVQMLVNKKYCLQVFTLDKKILLNTTLPEKLKSIKLLNHNKTIVGYDSTHLYAWSLENKKQISLSKKVTAIAVQPDEPHVLFTCSQQDKQLPESVAFNIWNSQNNKLKVLGPCKKVETNYLLAFHDWSFLTSQFELYKMEESRYLNLPEDVTDTIRFVISMTPMNSSGDSYHILAYLILCLANNKKSPQVLLTYDSDEKLQTVESKMNTYTQVTRILQFASDLGYAAHFLRPIEVNGGATHQNVRNFALVNHFKNADLYDEKCTRIGFVEQKALTTIIAHQFIAQGRDVTTQKLKKGFSQRDVPKEVKESLELKCSKEVKRIQTHAKESQLIILHGRYSSKANKEQNMDTDEMKRLESYLVSKRFAVWYIFTDGRTKRSFGDVVDNRTNPFPYEIDDKDYGKLLHLSLLVSLTEMKNLYGIIGNTSGTLDVAGFIGHWVCNLHQFKDKLEYQGYRILIQSAFLCLEDFKPSPFVIETPVENEKLIISKETMKKYFPNLMLWLLNKQNLLPNLKFTKPKLTGSGFSDLASVRIFTLGKEEESLPLPIMDEVESTLKNVFK